MAGYSGTPLPRKLGIKAGSRVAVLNAPEGFRETLGPLLEEVALSSEASHPQDILLFFTKSRAELEEQFSVLSAAITPAGSLWISWPKRASGVPTDLTENVVREIGLAAGLVDTKVCAVDEIWSGLRFVVRLKDRVGK
jgi:hypothetical protein